MGSPRIQRWAVTLSAYGYHIVYKPGKHHANGNALNRLPMSETTSDMEIMEQVFMIDVLDETLHHTNETLDG